ncbi:uncharacterized protein HKW66_Vig0016870 [Vigna angularis]|uniref:Uncharacterized protein n=1 Tax=Phaseolus angularis TaxID=3914 RepID=A0A8T0LGW5_PHAAN|nr:uncharacterized protein HKW66_Vig0016870 [Vigna angularis]
MKTGFHRWSSDDQRNVSDDELDGLDERKVGVVIDEQRGFRGLVSFEVALPLIPMFFLKRWELFLNKTELCNMAPEGYAPQSQLGSRNCGKYNFWPPISCSTI